MRCARLARLDLAERAGVWEKTVQRIELGDPGVGIGKFALALAALGQPDAIAKILRIEDDAVSLSRAVAALPKRGKVFGQRRGASFGRGGSGATRDDDGVGF